MSLLPDTASFHERVQDCFVAYRGRGVSLSATDVELLDAWAETGVPVEVVARGIRKASEAALWDATAGETHLRSLKACRRHVETEIKHYLRASAGRGEEAAAPAEPFEVTRHKKLVASLKKALKPGVPAWVARLKVPADFQASERQEALAMALLARALPAPRRVELLREARRLVENTQAVSAGARRESLRFHRAALVRHAWGLPPPW
jgi:hypothetical protein